MEITARELTTIIEALEAQMWRDDRDELSSALFKKLYAFVQAYSLEDAFLLFGKRQYASLASGMLEQRVVVAEQQSQDVERQLQRLQLEVEVLKAWMRQTKERTPSNK